MSNLRLWPLRVLWILVPFTTGALLDDALSDRVTSLRHGATAVFWVAWAATLVAMLVPRGRSLTEVRLVAPTCAAAALWCSALVTIDATAVAGVMVALAAAALSLVAPVGEEFVNGSSYGDERRMLLRPPVAMGLLLVPLAAIVVAVGALAGLLLVLAHVWVLGAVVVAIGVPLAAFATRALHQLTRRWVVFVPAGFVLHDHLVLREPVLFPREDIVSLGPAPADSAATDLTAGAAGLALQVDFAVPVTVTPTAGADEVEMVGITQFLVMPSRPGHLLAEAERRRIRVSRG
jgi:hypothetical protein